jgi:hypothetical protein
VIPQSVEVIGEEAFRFCNNLGELIIDASDLNLGASAFYGCSSLKEVTINGHLSKIPTEAFLNNGMLENLKITGRVDSIMDRAFYDCKSLKSIACGEGLKYIGVSAFYNCTSLRELSLPSSLESIDDGAFLLCKSLSKVDLPDGLLNIGNGAFVLCKSLGEFRIPRSVVSIGCCLQGTPIYEDQSNWENGLFYVDGCLMDVDKSLSGEVYVCRGTRLIASYALCNNKKITAVHIPSTVEYIGEGLISGSTNVSQIVVEEGNERYSSGANSNMLVNTEDMKLIALCEDVEMPNDIKIIGNGFNCLHGYGIYSLCKLCGRYNHQRCKISVL